MINDIIYKATVTNTINTEEKNYIKAKKKKKSQITKKTKNKQTTKQKKKTLKESKYIWQQKEKITLPPTLNRKS